MNTSQGGAGVLEVLIALSILSVVLLGIAGLHASALAYQQRTQRHLLAVLAAQNLAERMRAAPASGAARYQLAAGETPAAAADCGGGGCNAEAFASWQLSDWYADLFSAQGLLPTAKAAVTCSGSCGAGDGRVITVYWNASDTASSNWDCDAERSASRDCYRLIWQP